MSYGFEACAKWPRRMATATRAIRQTFANTVTEAKLLGLNWSDGPVIRQKHLDGLQLLVRAEGAVGRAIYFRGSYDPEETRYLRQSVRQADICFDVGANIGYYTLLMAQAAQRGNVHAFEPVPLTLNLLRTNVMLNEVQNVVVNGCAVGDRVGEVEFVVSRDDAFSSLVDTERKPSETKTSVLMTTLDRYCDERAVLRVDCLKVDVEGAEGGVLDGATELLRDRSRRPRLMLLELYDPMLTKFNSGIDDISRRLRSSGYSPFVCSRHRLVPFEREHFNHFYNVFFLQDEQHEGRKDVLGA